MSEAELQVLRARMLGGLRNKAARGELRIPLPAGLLWGEALDRIVHDEEGGAEAALRIFRQFRQRGCTVISVKESWLNGSPEVQGILIAFAGWMAQRESARRSERIKAGLNRRRSEGKQVGRQQGAKDKGRRERSGYVASWGTASGEPPPRPGPRGQISEGRHRQLALWDDSAPQVTWLVPVDRYGRDLPLVAIRGADWKAPFIWGQLAVWAAEELGLDATLQQLFDATTGARHTYYAVTGDREALNAKLACYGHETVPASVTSRE